MKLDATVRRETVNIAAGTLICSALMQSVFLLIRRWDYTVLLGNLLGGGAAILNFLLLGLTIQRALLHGEENLAARMKLSQLARTLVLLGVAVLGVVLPCFQMWAVLISLFFPRITILFLTFSRRRAAGSKGGDTDA